MMHRGPRTLQTTSYLLSRIFDHLLTCVPPQNVVVVESPPLLYEDLHFYQKLSFRLAKERGFRIAQTMVGETHIQKRDGVHIEDIARPLLTETLACAILNLNPHATFQRSRPPYGKYGPWLAPADQGMKPSYRGVATAPPFSFRHRHRNKPRLPSLMDIEIPIF